jgi:hypothetical protein
MIAANLPAGTGLHIPLPSGHSIDIINTHGSQVVDFWAFVKADPTEHLSMPHCRSCLEKLHFTKGDALYSSKRKRILEITEDTSPGVHDSLLSACDDERYRLLGVKGWHANCAHNLEKALEEANIRIASLPAPWNIFENVATEGGWLEIKPPLSKKGDYVRLRALDDLVLVLSACPMDVVPTNGTDCKPQDIQYRLTQSPGSSP